MSITIELSAQEIAALKQLTRLDNDAEAVIQAARTFQLHTDWHRRRPKIA